MADQHTAQLDLGFGQYQSGQLDDAARTLSGLLDVHPAAPDSIRAGALHILGLVAMAQGDMAGAKTKLEHSVTLNNGFAMTHYDLGVLLLNTDDPAGAEQALTRALALQPVFPAALNNRGLALERMGRDDDALSCFEQAVQQDGNDPAARINLGNALNRLGRAEEAEPHFRTAVRIAPDMFQAYHGLAFTLTELDRLAEAERNYRNALEHAPDSFLTHTNLGLVLALQDRLEEAEQAHRAALAIQPQSTEALTNLGIALLEMDRTAEAETCFRDVLRLDPNHARAHLNLAYALFGKDDLSDAWAEYDWGFAAGERGRPRVTNAPRWTGHEPGRLLVSREQGVGDEVTFANCYGDLLADKPDTVIECDPRLKSLLARSFPDATIADQDTTPDDAIAFHIPAASLGGLYRRTAQSYGGGAYLTAAPARVAFWRDRLAAIDGNPKVGFHWTSQLLTAKRRAWFSDIDDWADTLRLDGVTFVNLQYGAFDADLELIETRLGIRIHRWPDIDLKNDLDELAALTAALDAVIGAPGASSSIAAAVGTPVFQVRRAPFPAHLQNTFAHRQLVQRHWNQSWPDAIARARGALVSHLGLSGKARTDTSPSVARTDTLAPTDKYHRARDLVTNGDAQQARPLLEELLTQYPEDGRLHEEMGHLLLGVGASEDAATSFDAAATRLPANAHARQNVGVALLNANRPTDALPHFDDAIAIKPSEGLSGAGVLVKLLAGFGVNAPNCTRARSWYSAKMASMSMVGWKFRAYSRLWLADRCSGSTASARWKQSTALSISPMSM